MNCTIKVLQALFSVLLYHLPNSLEDENQKEGAGMTRTVRREKER